MITSDRTLAAPALGLALLAGIFSAQAAVAQSHDAAAQAIISSPKFQTATAFIERDYDRLVDEIITLTEIPAPPFKETRRAEAYLHMLQSVGLTDVEQDPEGNVFGIR